jgi:hypothetical protein
VYVLECQEQALCPARHKAPHEAVNVEWGPTDSKHHDQHNCRDREGGVSGSQSLSAAFPGLQFGSTILTSTYPTGHPSLAAIQKFLGICLSWPQFLQRCFHLYL